MKTIDERVQEFLKRGAFTQADLTDLLDGLHDDVLKKTALIAESAFIGTPQTQYQEGRTDGGTIIARAIRRELVKPMKEGDDEND